MPTQQTANGNAPVVGTDVPSEDELQLRDVAVERWTACAATGDEQVWRNHDDY
jgi:hypothetical protein